MNAYNELENIFSTASHLNHARALLNWDEAVMMPLGGEKIRAEAIATLKVLYRNLLADEKNINLIHEAKEISMLSEWERKNLALIEKKVLLNSNIPEELTRKLAKSSVITEQMWRRLKPNNNWTDFLPYIKETVELVREYSICSSDIVGLKPYDSLVDMYSPGITQEFIDPIFNKLKLELPDLIKKIEEFQNSLPIEKFKGPFDVKTQKIVCEKLMRSIGFDFNRGRLDTSLHPFCGEDPDDTRITTRYAENDFSQALLGACHEAGHAMYQFNLPEKWKRQPVGETFGMSVHESQSLIIEMHACRSKAFSEFLSLVLIDSFGIQTSFSPENIYRNQTAVQRDYIRVDSDEVTYPLHVILRYELERDLINKKIEVEDLPELWDFKMKEYLGISTGNNHKIGVMQDVHWPSGTFGYFPAYNIGSLTAAQLFHHINCSYKNIPENLKKGDFTNINTWLNKNFRGYASFLEYDELMIKSTGEVLNPSFFIQHIEKRYLSEVEAYSSAN